MVLGTIKFTPTVLDQKYSRGLGHDRNHSHGSGSKVLPWFWIKSTPVVLGMIQITPTVLDQKYSHGFGLKYCHGLEMKSAPVVLNKNTPMVLASAMCLFFNHVRGTTDTNSILIQPM